MEVIHHEGWIRFVKEGDLYKVQMRRWWKWRDVTAGPFGPYRVGLSTYKNKSIAFLHFIDCFSKGKRYTLRGVK